MISVDVPLAPLTTLGLGGRAKWFAQVHNHAELREVLADADGAGDPVLVLGGGSNIVIGDEGWNGLVVQLALRQRSVFAKDGVAHVTASAGVEWDDFVADMIDQQLVGVECLSGIPGYVGATPMQNVGAYGQEVSDTITDVFTFDRTTGKPTTLSASACEFGYRTSKLKGSQRWIVSGVVFRLVRGELSAPIRYAELARALGVQEGERAPLPRVREAVLALRRSKGMVIDKADPDSRSAGSFFTNPIVTFELTASIPTDAPRWPQPDGRVKLSAAWLIEHAGFAKGYTRGAVGISNKHALALVHHGGGTTRELLALAVDIQAAVRDRFAIALEIEPVIV